MLQPIFSTPYRCRTYLTITDHSIDPSRTPKLVDMIDNFGAPLYISPPISELNQSYFSLWAATGQNALESSRILLLSASATSTSILKNLVLPGIGHFTILDASNVTPQDAGNNFFLEGPDSIGKNRAEEAVRLLGELNDGVEGVAVKESIEDVLAKKPEWIKGFSLVIAHNLDSKVLENLSSLLWEEEAGPALIIVKSAGFLAEFFIQFHDHASKYAQIISSSCYN